MGEMTKPALAPDVAAELADPRFVNRKHGSRSTNTAGCKGPLCKHVEKLAKRRTNELKAYKAGREYQPSLRRARDDSRTAEFEAVIAWHHADHLRRREEAQRLSPLTPGDAAAAPVMVEKAG